MTLYPFNYNLSLQTALAAYELWEADRRHFGYGQIYLSYSFAKERWCVLVSEDLMLAALPF